MTLPAKESKHTFMVFHLALEVWCLVFEDLWLAAPRLDKGRGIAVVGDMERPGCNYDFCMCQLCPETLAPISPSLSLHSGSEQERNNLAGCSTMNSDGGTVESY
jgi:hypothetical protein